MAISIDVPERGRPETTVTKSRGIPPVNPRRTEFQAGRGFRIGAPSTKDAGPAFGRPEEDDPLVPETTRRKLRYCRIASDRLTLARFPDFLIVGPQRTGTTWLHAVLGTHPEVLLSDPKEIYFFSRLKQQGHPGFESDELDWYLDHFRMRWPRWVAAQARTLARTGRPYRPRVRGEATASYAAMDRDLLEEIAALRADVKVLMMVRHPVDRAWSHAKKDLARNRGRRVEDVGDKEWKAFFRDPYQVRCARYARNLEAWRAVFGEDRVFFGTFEELTGDPESLLARVTAFLGIDTDRTLVDGGLLRSVVNPTAASGPPEPLRRDLEGLLTREIEEWGRLVGPGRTTA